MSNIIKYQKFIIRFLCIIMTIYFLSTVALILLGNTENTNDNPLPDISVINNYLGL